MEIVAFSTCTTFSSEVRRSYNLWIYPLSPDLHRSTAWRHSWHKSLKLSLLFHRSPNFAWRCLTHTMSVPLLQVLTRAYVNHGADPGPTTVASFPLLPALAHMELCFACASPSQFVDFISARWRAHGRTLQSFTLSHCTSTAASNDWGSRCRLPRFRAGGDLKYFCKEWEVVKGFISEGLLLKIE